MLTGTLHDVSRNLSIAKDLHRRRRRKVFPVPSGLNAKQSEMSAIAGTGDFLKSAAGSSGGGGCCAVPVLSGRAGSHSSDASQARGADKEAGVGAGKEVGVGRPAGRSSPRAGMGLNERAVAGAGGSIVSRLGRRRTRAPVVRHEESNVRWTRPPSGPARVVWCAGMFSWSRSIVRSCISFRSTRSWLTRPSVCVRDGFAVMAPSVSSRKSRCAFGRASLSEQLSLLSLDF